MTIKIQTSKDYKAFRRIKGNREIKKAHVNKLRTAIEGDPQVIEYNPILVNEKMEIIDGQHRFEAIKQLNLPVHYQTVQGLTLENVQALNSNTKSWTPNDYAYAYAELGNKHYRAYLEHRKAYGFNHDVTMNYCSVGYPITGESFKHGKFRCANWEYVVKLSEQLIDIGKFVPHWNLRSTALAFLHVAQHPEYDHKRMMQKLEKLGKQMERFTQLADSIRAFEHIYNHGLNINSHVRFY